MLRHDNKSEREKDVRQLLKNRRRLIAMRVTAVDPLLGSLDAKVTPKSMASVNSAPRNSFSLLFSLSAAH